MARLAQRKPELVLHDALDLVGNTSEKTMKQVAISLAAVVRLWLHRQGLAKPRGKKRLTKRNLTELLERTGGLQLDTINVVDRAHYLTIWSRFGPYDRGLLDKWTYDQGAAYEYWGHEASLLPISHLPLGLRRMRQFPPKSWTRAAWWKHFNVSPATKRRVLARLRQQGPLESADFTRRPPVRPVKRELSSMPLPKEDKRALQLLWHSGKVAVRARRSFRRLWDLASRVYPEVTPASRSAFEDSWLLQGLSGNGIASERHLVGYITGPKPDAAERRRVILRNLKAGRVVPVRVEGATHPYYARPEHLEGLRRLPVPCGTTLLSPFDSLLWQRDRAEELLGFRYRIEIYVPPKKREFGYYALPILHRGRLVGRLDPKLHRDRGRLEIKKLALDSGRQGDRELQTGLRDAVWSLAEFLGATDLEVPRPWRQVLD